LVLMLKKAFFLPLFFYSLFNLLIILKTAFVDNFFRAKNQLKKN